ncbi:hypothetical protein ANN_00543 [Periplaneta americana]|uniref:Uncharacterized protein n=1 Tax=Periplaneta americana TaxID=6978 RepID=A0ABQ8TTH9_PERAM|nr:hypothetical protein ANN_00543 [Periplaneta americana]
MAGLCEGGNEPAGYLKAICKITNPSLVQRHTRTRLYKTLARLVLRYGSEAWTLRKCDDMTKVSFCTKKNKWAILLSTMYHDNADDEHHPEEKPEIVKFYSLNKDDVDASIELPQSAL